MLVSGSIKKHKKRVDSLSILLKQTDNLIFFRFQGAIEMPDKTGC
jgi:hypothetical protein